MNYLRKRFPILYFRYTKYKINREIKYCVKIPSELYGRELEKIYKKTFGRELNLEEPKAYTEKIQWSKINDFNPLKTELSDKYKVREYVENRIGSQYLIPLLGVWESYARIEFDKLPKSFVLKTTNGSGTNILVKDKEKIDKRFVKMKIDYWMSIPFGFQNAFQLHYNQIQPLIVAEKYMEDSGKSALLDYKFLCFDGKVHAIWVDIDRFDHHRRNIYNTKWQKLPWKQKVENYDGDLEKPKKLEEMISIAERLSEGISHVRVDLYYINEKIYFGEMTFTNGSGLDRIYPDQYDFELGKLWNI